MNSDLTVARACARLLAIAALLWAGAATAADRGAGGDAGPRPVTLDPRR